MSETDASRADTAAEEGAPAPGRHPPPPPWPRRGMLLPELQRLAGELGIAGTAEMRKGDLVAAISARQAAASQPWPRRRSARRPRPAGTARAAGRGSPCTRRP